MTLLTVLERITEKFGDDSLLDIEKGRTSEVVISNTVNSLIKELAESEIRKIEEKYKKKLEINPELDRKLVSFQANKVEPIYRWFKYREGFSKTLIEYLLKDSGAKQGSHILDPFAGTGITCFTANNQNFSSTALELLPVGADFIRKRMLLGKIPFGKIVAFAEHLKSQKPWKKSASLKKFGHLRITAGAFSEQTELEMGKFRSWAEQLSEPDKSIADLICYSILEEISYTRKDGQYLRWDHRAPRIGLKSKFDKGAILSFTDAVEKKCTQIIDDLQNSLTDTFDHSDFSPKLLEGQNFATINQIKNNSVDFVITSPPYCNRYDYTRTYALELAYLGNDEAAVKQLRQALLTCTVENKPKNLVKTVGEKNLFLAKSAFDGCKALQATLLYLNEQKEKDLLNNPGIYAMVYGYFLEMSVHLTQVVEKMKSGSRYYMVNDNVKYAGLDIPVDCMLTEIAEDLGFVCRKIWVLPVGKGNSSQQMKIHGRSELRKCIYVWEKM
jgi:DNA modification methylase